MAKIKITLTKSFIGYDKKQRETVKALGLKKLHSSAVQEDTPDILCKVRKVAHLVTVEQIEE